MHTDSKITKFRVEKLIDVWLISLSVQDQLCAVFTVFRSKTVTRFKTPY